jgi:uncharacterized protein
MVSLLDVNVLMALGWSNHEHHEAAHGWFGSQQRWATCALTETAFVRLSSNPAVVGSIVTPQQAAIGLEKMTAHSGHVFWEATPSLSRLSCPAAWVQGHRQVTDSYLLALAEHHQGRLVTFDKRLAGTVPESSPIQLLKS